MTTIEDVNSKNILLSQIRECFGRVAYAHKTHEKQADILLKKDTFWKWIQISLSVLVSGSFLATLSDICGHDKLWSLIGVFLATGLAAINLCFKNFNYGTEAQKHKEIAVQLWNVRETYISLITDFMIGTVDIKNAKDIRDNIQIKLSDIYKNAPRTNKESYLEAQKALKFNEDLTFSVSEIDMLLPNNLRLNKDKGIK